MISLVWTLASALLFQPALMGPASVKNETAKLLHETLAGLVQMGYQDGSPSSGERCGEVRPAQGEFTDPVE